MRNIIQVALFAAVSFVVSPLHAVSLDIAYGGVDGTRVLWDVRLTFNPPTAVALEIGFEHVGGQIVDIIPNTSVIEHLNPGQNPFTGTVTEGVSIHDFAATADSAFAALSGFLTSSSPVKVLTIATDGPGSLSLGGHDHNGLFTGARVAQGGENFDGLTSSLTIEFLDADFNRDLMVDEDDLAIWKSAFGGPATSTSGDADGDGLATGADFLKWQRQFENRRATSTVAAASVPEPSAVSLFILAAACGGGIRFPRGAFPMVG
jgi:hypothetical protein